MAQDFGDWWNSAGQEPPNYPNFQSVEPVASTASPASLGPSMVAGGTVYPGTVGPAYDVAQPSGESQPLLPWYVRSALSLAGLPASAQDIKDKADIGRGMAQGAKELGLGTYQWLQKAQLDPNEYDTWIDAKRAELAADKKAPDTGTNPNYLLGYLTAKHGPFVLGGGLGGPAGMTAAGVAQPFVTNLWSTDDINRYALPTAAVGVGGTALLGGAATGGRALTQYIESKIPSAAKPILNLLGSGVKQVIELPGKAAQQAPWLTGILGMGTESALGGPGGQ
jgi:hypothetical protein